MEIRDEEELDAAIAIARLAKTERLLRQARGRTLPRPRQAIISLILPILSGVVLVRGLAAGHFSFLEVVLWALLGLLLAYALQLGKRIDALVELLELSQAGKPSSETREGTQAP